MTFDNPTNPWHYSYQRICDRVLIVAVCCLLLAMAVFFNGWKLTLIAVFFGAVVICGAVAAVLATAFATTRLVEWMLDLD